MALGSDSPVTPVAPWEAVRACVNHRNPRQRISARSAFLAHTRGGWRAAGIDDRGYLDLGQPASFAIWSVGRPGRAGPRRPDPDLEHRPAVGHPGPARPVAGSRAADDAAHRRPGAHGVRARGGARRPLAAGCRRGPSGTPSRRRDGAADPDLTDAGDR